MLDKSKIDLAEYRFEKTKVSISLLIYQKYQSNKDGITLKNYI